ncbi:MAG: H-NS histone family protein [Thiolinea sp.]
MAFVDLDKLSTTELENLKDNLDKVIKKNRYHDLMALHDKVVALVERSPFTLDEVLHARKVRKPVKPKYRNPDNISQTWAGRGRKPVWVEQCLQAGKTLEDLEV